MAQTVWYVDDIERIAQGLILLGDDPSFRAGVMALAHALGATKIKPVHGITWYSINEVPDEYRRINGGR